MYSIYGDTVLDPFWGTGTTSLAAMASGRHSVGYELEPTFVEAFERRARDARSVSREMVENRLAAHRAFVERRRDRGEGFQYEAEHYDFPVVTKQERSLRFYVVDEVTTTSDGYHVRHEPYDSVGEE